MSNKDVLSALFRDYPDVVTVEQMATMLGISLKSAYHIVHNNKVKYFKIGRTYRVAKYHILEYLRIIHCAEATIG